MEELKFSKLQKGDIIFTLERDRRSGYPIFDRAQVLKVGDSKPVPVQGSYKHSVEISIQDSISQMDLLLPTDASEGIYNGIYYTTNIENVVNEVNNQKQNAATTLQNIPKYEAIIAECNTVMEYIVNNFGPNHQQQVPNEFAKFKDDIYTQLANQNEILAKLCNDLGIKGKE